MNWGAIGPAAGLLGGLALTAAFPPAAGLTLPVLAAGGGLGATA